MPEERKIGPNADVEYDENFQPVIPGPRMKTSFAEEPTCGRCKGTGRIDKLFMGNSITGGPAIGAPGDAPCPACGGTGISG